MPPWLTPQWVEASAQAFGTWSPTPAGEPPVPAPVALTVTVTGGPEGDVHWEGLCWAAVGGQETVRAARVLGLTLPSAEAGAILSGDLSPSVAFMQGRLRTSGDQGAVLDILAATATDAFGVALAGIRSFTDGGAP